MTNLSIVY